ncbi:MAG: aminotransferase class V-fold PLP-dependent enzyme [Treponema sp.]|nr:aminotransferase class V-fold PLP-dependent enzyme [Treponema sp.]
MLNFSVGPVQMDEKIRKQGFEQIPYFRTAEFSNIMLENEKLFCEFLNSPENSRTLFITGSGTSSMEACVMNFFTAKDKVLVVNGGSFGGRLVELCKIFEIPYEEIKLDYGQVLTNEILKNYENKGCTAMLLQHHETSTGILYDLNMVGDFCKKNNLFLCVDCISSFLANEIDMQKNNINAVISGSQKAVALPPGLSFITIDEKAINRIKENQVKSLYFNLKNYLKDGERGQTPFTPAVSVLLQLNIRLKAIKEAGGAGSEVAKVKEISEYFRNGIKDLPLENFSKSPANAVTALTLKSGKSAYNVFLKLKDNYDIFVCPNGGELAEKIFRVGHIGYITHDDVDALLKALHELNAQGEL